MNGAIDYEALRGDRSYTFEVSFSDGEFTNSGTQTVSVMNVNEAPVFSTDFPLTLEVNEGPGMAGKDIGTVNAVDPDGGNVYYSLTSGDAT